MIGALLHHVRRHGIAYLALACSLLALGGGAYAALQVPFGAVGERQLRNHVIDPIKWDSAYTTGFVRRWAGVSAAGSLTSSSPNGESAEPSSGSYVVTWGDAFAGFCVPLVTIDAIPPTTAATTTTTPTITTTSTTSTTTTTTTTTTSSGPPTGNGAYADASIVTHGAGPTFVDVATFNGQGQATPEPFSVVVICPPGAGSGQSVPTTLP